MLLRGVDICCVLMPKLVSIASIRLARTQSSIIMQAMGEAITALPGQELRTVWGVLQDQDASSCRTCFNASVLCIWKM